MAPLLALPDVSGAMAGNGAGLVAFFALGLLGSVHCLGMCGPLVTTYAERLDEGGPTTWREIRQQGLFNVGRTVSYTAIGAALGGLGAALYNVASLTAAGTAVRGVVGVAVGLAVFAVGVGYLTRGSATDLAASLPVLGTAFRRVTAALTGRIDAWVDGPGILALGAIHGLLPCPLLYPAFLYAFATGSPVAGGAALFALGVGTFPLVFAYGTAFGALSPTTRSRLHRVLGVVFLVLALVPLAHGLAAFGVSIPSPALPMPG
ncbi:MAG: sulfite exporter TauE/SafE family protein [Haloarculaceae archaeon]